MSKFSIVRAYYTMGLWSKSRVHQAVECNWINKDEYLLLTGEDYE